MGRWLASFDVGGGRRRNQLLTNSELNGGDLPLGDLPLGDLAALAKGPWPILPGCTMYRCRDTRPQKPARTLPASWIKLPRANR
jgi:hypothetical protein